MRARNLDSSILRGIGTDPVPTEMYHSEAFFEAERDALWRQTWLLAGRASEIPEAGDFFQFTVPAGDVSVIVVRTKDGGLRAYHNVCRHRGSRLVLPHQRRGNMRTLRCRYHAWSWNLDGELRGIPESQYFERLDRERLDLIPVAIDEWGGLVFVNLAPEPDVSLSEYLAPLPSVLGDYLRDEDWTWGTGWKAVFEANWKHLIDIQIEGYHATPMHQQTLGRFFRPEDVWPRVYPESPGVAGKLAVQRAERGRGLTRVGELAMQVGNAAIWTDRDASTAGHDYPGAINDEAKERWVFDIYTILPNLVLQVSHEHIAIQTVWPISTRRTFWMWDYYYRFKARNFGELFAREFNRVATFNALSEDIPATEGVEANVRAGLVDKFYLGDLEACVRSYLNKIAERVAAQGSVSR